MHLAKHYLDTSKSRFRSGSSLALVVALALFGMLASTSIRTPGVEYDEALFVNAAIGGNTDEFVYRRMFGVPFMLMPYIGALKAYIYYPVFYAFGVSPETIRYPVIALSLITVVIIWRIGRLCFGPVTGSIVILLIAADPTFIFMSKLDYGPIALMMLLKSAALLFFFRAITTRAAGNIVAFAVFCVLGIFDKLNFIWFLVAIVPAAILTFRSDLLALYRRNVAQATWSVLFLGACVAFAVMKGIVPLLSGQRFDVIRRLPADRRLYETTMDGTALYYFVTGTVLPFGTFANIVSLVGVFGAMWIVALSVVRYRWRRPIALGTDWRDGLPLFFLTLCTTMSLEIIVTRDATGPHHMMMLYPFHYFLLGSVVMFIARAWSAGKFSRARECALHGAAVVTDASIWAGLRRRSSIEPVLIAATLLLVAAELRVDAWYETKLNGNFHYSSAWSPQIYDLAVYAQQHSGDEVISADWGIHNQVFALVDASTRRKCLDLWPTFQEMNDPAASIDFYRAFFSDKSGVVLVHAEGAAIMPRARDQFLAFAHYYAVPIRLSSTFVDGQGQPVFEAYSFSASP